MPNYIYRLYCLWPLGTIVGHFRVILGPEQDTGVNLEPISHHFCYLKGPEWPQIMCSRTYYRHTVLVRPFGSILAKKRGEISPKKDPISNSRVTMTE